MGEVNLPSQRELQGPTLEALKSLGGYAHIRDIEDAVARRLGLTKTQLELDHPGVDNRTAFQYRCAWARTQLKAKGRVENPKKNIWSLVESDPSEVGGQLELPGRIIRAFPPGVSVKPRRSEPERLEDVGAHLIGCLYPGRKNRMFNDAATVALVRRLGLDGRPASTLREAGESVGLTRERIRQIQERYETRIRHPVHTRFEPLPVVLEQAFAIALATPAGDLELAVSLQDRGLTAHSKWTIDALLRLARLSGRFDIAEDLQRIVSQRSEDEQIRNRLVGLLPKAVWMASAMSGFCHESALADQLAEIWQEHDLQAPLPGEEVIQRLIADHPSILKLPLGFLYSTGGKIPMAGRGIHGSRIVGQSRKMLGVSSPLHVSDLRQGLIRYSRFKKIPLDLPTEVLRRFFDQHPEFQINERGMVTATWDLEEPSGLTGWLIEKMRTSDYGFLTFSQAISLGRRNKNNTSSLSSYLTYGVEIRRDRRGIYFPVGELPDAHRVEQGLGVAGRSSTPTVQCWAFDRENRTVSLELEVGHSALGGVVSVAAADHGYLELLGDERFSILDPQGVQHGFLSVSFPMMALKGIGTYFAHKFIEPGDEINIEIDLSALVATANR